MDWQIIVNIVAGVIVGVGGWFARRLYDAVDDLKSNVSRIELHLSENYVKKSEVDSFKTDMDKRFDRIEVLLDKLYDKLDNKVDK